MNPSVQFWRLAAAFLFVFFCVTAGRAQGNDSTVKLKVNWDKVERISQTSPTLQVVVNPPLRRGTPVHDNAFKALHDLQADYVRYVPWLPYPKLGVAELEPPHEGKTSWNFSLIDPMTIDFLEATRGHSVILNFSTIPQWMFKTDKPVPYPPDPDQVTWNYEQGTELRDPTFKEAADYFARVLAWYTKAGFTDELGKRHESGYHYSIPYWEVLNEPDLEHHISPETYTKLYDAVVEAMQREHIQTKFVGLALAFPSTNPDFLEYFLNHANHKPGIPLDFISYHFYAVPTRDQTPEVQQYTFFTQADGFLNTVRYIESIRKRLSPRTQTTIDEIGAISADEARPIPNSYWNLSGVTYAYIFGELTRMGIEVAGESQLVGYPTQFPSVSLVDWNTGLPNARFLVLKLLRDNFGPGDKVVETKPENPYVYALGAVGKDGKRRLLLVNRRDRTFDLSIPGASGGQLEYVDQTTSLDRPRSVRLDSDKVTLNGFGVASVTLP
jgi:hypothetical protein